MKKKKKSPRTNEKKRILIADPDPVFCKNIKHSRRAAHYQIESCLNGVDCLKKIETFLPDLLLIDLMLPNIHGIEILRKIKSDPRTNAIGVIITSANVMVQNYRSAVKQNADCFLTKPLEIPYLFGLFKLFFEDKLQPIPIEKSVARAEKKLALSDGKERYYTSKLHSPTSYIKFWGTRGSNPVSGSDYLRFGGNTCCLEIHHEDELIIIDAGTGIRALGNLLDRSKFKTIHILFSHTHWDHLAGFPFFAPIYDPECHVHIWTPIGYEKTAREIFKEMFAYAYFPVRLDDIKATLTFKDIHEGVPFEIGPFEINSHYAFHPGATLCFKIRCNNKTFGYVTDNELLMGYHGNPNAIGKKHPRLAPYLSQINFFKKCDFLIHEAQYTTAEYESKVGWGHSSVSNTAVLIKYADVSQWFITHHDPKHTDLDLLNKVQMQFDILDDCKIDCHTRSAYDGLILPLD